MLVGTPKPPLILWMFAGLVPWMFLQRAISDGGMALVNNQALMTKIYLPRLYLPLAACGNALVDMAINCGLLGGSWRLFCFVKYGWTPTWQIVFVVPLFALLFVAALGLAFTLSAATVLYRDLRFIIPFIVQFGLWLSTVTYPAGDLRPSQCRRLVRGCASRTAEGSLRAQPADGHHQRLPQRDHRPAVGMAAPGHVDRAERRAADLRPLLLQARRAPVRRHRLNHAGTRT